MKHFYFLILFVFTLQACHCDSKEKERINITADDRSWIPYQKDEVVHFIHSNGQNIDFKVNDVYITKEKELPGYDCICCDYTTVETLHADLHSDLPFLDVKISRKATRDTNLENFLRIKIQHYNFYKSLETVDFQNITINNQDYQDVYKFENSNQDMSIIAPYIIYYNAAYGIIQIIYTNHETITLQN